MSVMFNGKQITGMELNGHRIVEGKLNGQTLFKFEGTPYMSFQIQTKDDKKMVVPLKYGDYGDNLTNISIVWGDGSITVIEDGVITLDLCTHTYETAGIYDIFIYSYNNKIPQFNFSNDSQNQYASCLIKMNNPILPMINTDGTKLIEGVKSLFNGAKNLEYLPDDLFKYNNEATDFSFCFANMSAYDDANMHKFMIPHNLFDSCVNMVNAKAIFAASRLKIPNDIFSKNINLENLSDAFETCYLSDSTNLLSSLTKLKSLSNAFASVTFDAVTIPNLDNNIALEDVSLAFYSASGVIPIPGYYFKNNINITDFSGCFSDTNLGNDLVINRNIFCDEDTEMETRFQDKNIQFNNCFSRSSYHGKLVGTAPQLWNYSFGSVVSTSCFDSYAKPLTNYYIIPESWGGPYKNNSMIFIIDTTKVSETNRAYSLPFYAGTYSNIGTLTIDWGDGNTTSITNKTITASNRAHTYSSAGEYAITIISSNGNIPRFMTNSGSDWGYEDELNNSIQLMRIETPLLHMYYDSNNGNVEVTTLNQAFNWCKNLYYIYEDVFKNNSQITQINSIFYNCSSLTTLNPLWFKSVPNITTLSATFNKCGVTNVPSNLFEYATKLNDLTNCFLDCVSLTNIEAGVFDECPLESIAYAFSGCSNLTSIPTDLFKYNVDIKYAQGTFSNCTSLQTVPEYLFRYNTKIFDFSYCFDGCTNLTINRNIFCDEDTEMATRFATGDIHVEIDPEYSNMTFVNAFFDVSKGEAPQLWNYTYKINITNPYKEQEYILDYANGSECFKKSKYQGSSFINNMLNYSLIPESWGGEYIMGGMTFLIDTRKYSSTNTQFVLPFAPGTYQGLGTLTIDWGDDVYTTKSVEVGDDLSGAKFALDFPDNLYESLPTLSNELIVCKNPNGITEDLHFSTYHSSWDGGYSASVQVFSDEGIIMVEEGSLTQVGTWYSADSYDDVILKETSGALSNANRPVVVSSVDTTNPAYQYIKLKIPANQTIIDDGIVTEELCTHTYVNPGVYMIKIKSSNNKIPRMQNTSLQYGTALITRLRDTLLHMLNEDGTDTTNITGLFSNSPIISIPVSLFYYNRNIEDVSNLFEQNQITSIPEGLFGYLSNLKKAYRCFSKCTALTSIPKELFYTAHLLEDVSYCFNGCTAVTDIPEAFFFHNPLITNFSNCFKSCSSLNSIGVNLFCDEDEDKETRFANAEIDFSGCFADAGSSTNTITLPDLWNYTYYLVDSRNCFSGFNGNPTNWADVPVGWGGNKKAFTLNISVSNDDLLFIVPFKPGTYSYSGDVNVNWGDGNTTTISSPVTQEQCSHTYGSSGSYSIILDVVGDRMPLFSFGNTSPINASKLLSVEGTLGRMSNTDNDIVENLEGEQINVANFDYMFSGCSNLTKVSSSLLQLNDGDQTNDVYPNAVRMFEDSGIESLIENFFPALGEDVNACFYNCTNLIKIPQLIGALNYNSCFYGCTSLVDIPYDTFAWRGQGNSKSKTFNFCFSNCISLKVIPDRLFLFLDEEGVDEFTGCFNNCINLETIPDGLFENTTAVDYSGCFSACNKLKINPNIFGSSVDRFSKLKDDQTVDISSMFALTNSFVGTSKGTAPELWNYVYAPANYVNIFQQENDKSETKSGVDVTYNVNSSILINGSALGQADFISETFTFNINPSRWYNFALEKNDGSVTQTSTYLLKLTLTNSTGTEYYSKIFSTIDDLGKWEGLNFVSSSSSTFKLTIRVYGGNAYDNLSITPKLSLAKVTFSQCFKGQTTNSLLNYNNIPSSWK